MGVWLGSNYAAGAPNIVQPVITWNMLIVLSMFLLMAWVLNALITLQRELEERVRTRTEALRQAVATRERLQREILELSVRERSSIGRDLHDGLGQHLTATAYAAQVLAQQLAARSDQSASSARTIVGLVEEGIAQTRQLSRGLLLAAIEPERLSEELEEMAAGVRRHYGVACLCETRDGPHAADAAAASHLYRIAQEAVPTPPGWKSACWPNTPTWS